ncbi:MAG TPA: B-box zinc finger protein, partial [Anaerolineaceae bacterium]|nr:B-box zinc finger protein [Anaerolineaceae bacterium]
MSDQIDNAPPQSAMPDTLYCKNHPQRETYLRCNRCNDPICVQCAVLTPTGYRCKNCISGQQKVFETSEGLDVP